MTTLRPVVIPPLSAIRRAIGFAALLLSVAAAVLFGLGAWNPQNNVFLRTYFGSPVLGVPVVAALAIASSYILLPVRNEAAQHKRVLVRMMLFVVLVLSLIVFGFVQTIGVFTYDPKIIAHSADGRRSAALVKVEGQTELHVFVGTGLGTRDAGNLGVPCGTTITVTFQGDDLIMLSTFYGDFQLHLDPVTAHPRDVIGPTCSR